VKLPVSALLGALLLAAPLGAAQEAEPAPEAPPWARLAAELGALARGVAPEVVGPRVAELGSPALVFDALGLQELPLEEGALALGPREHAALLEGARRLGRAAFQELWSAAASASDAARRRTAIELVGLCGKTADLATALQAAAPAEEGAGLDTAALALLEEAAGRLLAREREALEALRPAIVNGSPETSGYLIRALGRAPDERTLGFLVRLMGYDRSLELPALSEIAHTARQLAPPFEENLRASVRERLSSDDRQVVRMAVVALAELWDEEALPALIELCAGSDQALAAAAFVALERTTGLAFPRRPERWSSWFRSEQQWLDGEGARLPEQLESLEVARVLAALRGLAGHRLGREHFAQLVAGLLEHEDARVRREACRTLGTLGCPSAREPLEKTLSDPDADVVAAAQVALRAMRHGA